MKIFYRFCVLLATVWLSTPVNAQGNISASYNPPPVGSKFVYDLMATEITSNSGIRIEFNTTVNGKTRTSTFSSLFITVPGDNGKIHNEEKMHSSLWPLKVGNKVEFEVDAGRRGTWLVSTEVVGTEAVEVGGEMLDAFRIEIDEEATTHDYRHLKTIWYAPILGVPVKSFQKVTKGSYYGRTRQYAMQSYQVPGLSMRAVNSKSANSEKPEGSSVSIEAKLSRLKKLFDSNLISETDYEKKKEELLSKM
jgi:hypothetical protein